MLNGYKQSCPSQGKYMYVPSSKNFSLLLNHSEAFIVLSGIIAMVSWIMGIVLLCHALFIAGGIVLGVALFIPVLACLGYKGHRTLGVSEYDYWLPTEQAYWAMSKFDRKRHKQTLIQAFHDSEVDRCAYEIFRELKANNNIQDLKSELEALRERKQILRELDTI